MGRLIIDGNAVYEIDEICMQRKMKKQKDDKAKRQKEKSDAKEKEPESI